MVTWDGGNLAMLDSDGIIVEASSESARHAVRETLSKPVREWQDGDATRLYNPGEDGFILAALRALPDATVTGGAE